MSRIANNPVPVPKGVDVTIDNGQLTTKGAKGSLTVTLPPVLQVEFDGGQIVVGGDRGDRIANRLSGTIRSTIANMVRGVSAGFERRLTLTGVGYRAQSDGKTLNLSLGYSHPIEYPIPVGITIETPSQTEIAVKGCDRQRVGQVAANIRAFRAPEPYKGKGVRYSDEQIVRKEAKKK